MNNQVISWAQHLLKMEYESSGVSQMSASGVKPPGVEHGVAMRTLQDIETARFGMAARAWENLHLDLARLTVETARHMYGDGEATDYEARYVGKSHFETIKWSQVNLERDAYVLQVWPTSLLPASPAGKLATVQELIAAGMIDKDVGQMLLDFPDLEAAQTVDNARIEYMDWAVNEMLAHGKYVRPQPYHGLVAGLRRMPQHIMTAERERAPEDRLQLLKNWINDANAILKQQLTEQLQAKQAQEPMQAGSPGPPPGPGEVGPPPEPGPGGPGPEAMPPMPPTPPGPQGAMA